MSNDLAAHQATIIGMEVLSQLRKDAVIIKRVRRDFDKEVSSYGKVVQVPVIGALSANDKTPGSDVTVQDATSTYKQVTLNKHKEATFIIEDIDKALSRNDVLQNYMGSAVKALAEKMEDDLFTLVTGFSGSVGTYGTDTTPANVRAARKALTDGLAPRSDRTLVLSTKDISALLTADSQFLASYNNVGTAQNVQEGIVGRYMGFDVMESNAVPLDNTTHTHNLAFHKEAIALVVRPLEPAPTGLGAISTIVTDKETGMTIRITLSYSSLRMGVQCTADILYGFAELRDALGIEVKS